MESKYIEYIDGILAGGLDFIEEERKNDDLMLRLFVPQAHESFRTKALYFP